MSSKEDLLHYLRHYRHDWLNHMQIIKGYLSMGKEEEAKRYMDQIILDAQHETKLSQMGHPELTFYMLTYNWNQKSHVKLEIEVNHEQDMLYFSSISEKYPNLYSWIKGIINILERRVDQNTENLLFCQFNIKDHNLTLHFEFEGGWDGDSGKSDFTQLAEKILKEQGKLKIIQCSDQECILELFP